MNYLTHFHCLKTNYYRVLCVLLETSSRSRLASTPSFTAQQEDWKSNNQSRTRIPRNQFVQRLKNSSFWCWKLYWFFNKGKSIKNNINSIKITIKYLFVNYERKSHWKINSIYVKLIKTFKINAKIFRNFMYFLCTRVFRVDNLYFELVRRHACLARERMKFLRYEQIWR